MNKVLVAIRKTLERLRQFERRGSGHDKSWVLTTVGLTQDELDRLAADLQAWWDRETA